MCLHGNRFEETRVVHDVCHQCYIIADKRGIALMLASCMLSMCLAESGTTTPHITIWKLPLWLCPMGWLPVQSPSAKWRWH